jgi:hypothetical protein
MFADARCKPWRGEADRVRSPPPWRFQDPVRPNIAAVSMTVTAVQQHATKHAVADTVLRADQINVLLSRACRQASVQSAPRVSLRQPEPFPQLWPRHRRTSHPVATHHGWHQNSSYSRSSGSEERNQSLSRHLAARTLCGSLARDPARVCFLRGWRGSPLTLRADQAAFNTAPSGTSPCVT